MSQRKMTSIIFIIALAISLVLNVFQFTKLHEYGEKRTYFEEDAALIEIAKDRYAKMLFDTRGVTLKGEDVLNTRTAVIAYSSKGRCVNFYGNIGSAGSFPKFCFDENDKLYYQSD